MPPTSPPPSRPIEGYTVFSGPTPAISRAQAERTGPGQAFARAIIEVAERFRARGCSVAMRWTPGHGGVEGDEVADEYARVTGESAVDAADRCYLREASLAHLARKTTEARAQNTREWLARAKGTSRKV